MPTTKIHGARQIKDATIKDAQIAADAAIALSKLAEAVIQADGGQAFTADQSMGGFKITNLDDPDNPQDAATRAWVLAQLAGFTSSSNAVRVRTKDAGANITLSGTQTISGEALSAGELVLLTSQTDPAENGVWVVAGGAWSRAPEANTWAEIVGLLVIVSEGTNVADTMWLSTTDTGGTLDTDDITFIQLPSASEILAGAGLSKTGLTIDVNADDNSVTVSANGISVKRSATGAITLDGANGLQVATDDSTIEKSGNALRVKDGGITAAKLAQSYVQVSKYIVRESPTGTINGTNDVFTLAGTPVAGTEMVFLNGLLQDPGAGDDYTISGVTITFEDPPETGDIIRVTYLAQ